MQRVQSLRNTVLEKELLNGLDQGMLIVKMISIRLK